jgi:hypothetical protein
MTTPNSNYPQYSQQYPVPPPRPAYPSTGSTGYFPPYNPSINYAAYQPYPTAASTPGSTPGQATPYQPMPGYPYQPTYPTNIQTGFSAPPRLTPVTGVKTESATPMPMTPSQIALNSLRSAYPNTPLTATTPHYANYLQQHQHQYALGINHSLYPGFGGAKATTGEEDEDEVGMDDADFTAQAQFQSQSKADLK